MLSAGRRIDSTESSWTLRDTGELVVLAPSNEKKTIGESHKFIVTGSGYSSEVLAQDAGARWTAVLQAAFVHVRLGADFEYKKQRLGGLTEVGLRRAAEVSGRPVENQRPGIMTYKTDERPTLASMSASPTLPVPEEWLKDAISVATRTPGEHSDEWELAYDLFSASSFQTSGDGRFMMLMMAIEAVLSPESRSDEARAHIEALVSTTRNSSLPQSDTDSIVGALRSLKIEPVGQAGRRLASLLEGKEYQGESPRKFFTQCYELRSQLVHGQQPRPARQEIDYRAAGLECYVSDLLSVLLAI
jgi:hypothetical protein